MENNDYFIQNVIIIYFFCLQNLFQIHNFVSKLSSFWVMDSVLANKDNQKYVFCVIWYCNSFKFGISLDFIWKFKLISLTISGYLAQKFENILC